MEPTEAYQTRLETLQSAVKGFDHALKLDLSEFDDETKDLIRNGQVQKFEYCTELMWKVMKHYLSLYEGLQEPSPKSVIKAFYRTQQISSDLFEALIGMIDHRNQFSHVYNEIEFLELHSELAQHSQNMLKVLPYLKGR